jgi:hypothetical protein
MACIVRSAILLLSYIPLPALLFACLPGEQVMDKASLPMLTVFSMLPVVVLVRTMDWACLFKKLR